jgi:Ca-activated chloride channel homolog
MRQLVPWVVAAALAIPGAAIPQSQSAPQSRQDQKPPAQNQSQDQTPAAVQGQSTQTGKPGAAQSQQNPPQISIVSSLVLVPVTVKNSAGQLVGDLTKDQFRIFDDGKEQPIAKFSIDPFPLTAVVVLDNDLSLKAQEQVQKSLESIAASVGPDDETALMLFNQFPEPLMDFTKDNDALFTQLHRLRLGSTFPGDAVGPMTAGPTINNQSQEPQVPVYGMKQEKVTKDLDDAVHAAAESLRNRGNQPNRRKIIFLIADGQNSHHNKWTLNQTLQLLLSSDISVYTVTVGSTKLIKHEPSHMARYASDTGGDAYFATKQGDLERLYSAVTEEARNQYTLGFAPQNPSPGEFHTIEVRVERTGLSVSARQGYYPTAR